MTRFAAAVHLVVRGDKLRVSKIMSYRVIAHDRIQVRYETEIAAIASCALASGAGEEVVGIKTADRSGSIDHISVSGVFIAIGNDPRTSLVAGQLELNSYTYFMQGMADGDIQYIINI
ncbi:hypothetical protein SB659_16760 [Arthrobacter sp. SIMBA_036]|uniref:hypothetical protein n=1 Tax=Arthrobacter sp. SIMBA_036 TaxID=3085778 RepID=UPI00397CAE48